MSDLPTSWLQIGFDEAVELVSDRGFRIKQKAYLPAGDLPVVDQGEGLIGGYTNDLNAKVDSPAPVIVFGDHTRRFKFVKFPFAVGADGVKLFAPTAIWDPIFLYLQLGTIDLENRGYGRHYQHLRKELLALPPAHEQTRIVEKLEELLSDLDAGVAELKAAQKKLGQYRQSLLKAAVEGALTADWRAAQAPLSPRGRGVGGEGQPPPSNVDPTWLLHRSRELRQEQTPAEQALWQQLRAKRFSGFKFRRQQPLDRYIVDFVCFAQKLIIELDGGQHAEAQTYDAERDAWLKQQGFRVLRFWNNEWATQPKAVLEAIWLALRQEEPPLPNPSPARGEGLMASCGGEGETGAQLLQRILTERRARWEAKQLTKFESQGKVPPKDWQKKYPEPVQPDTSDLPELPVGWVWSSIGECFYVGVGATPSRKEPNYWNGEIPWVSSGEVQFSRITKTKERITREGLNNSSTQINPVGSVMLGMIGEGKTRGQVSILNIEAANNQNCAAIWVSDTEIQSEYVYYWLWSQYEQTRRGSSGNNQPALNKSIVESIPFPLPPLHELSAIVALVSASIDQIQSQEQSLEISFKQSAAQRKNILKAAFSGQLVPQDPNDEPASVLLERIRAERAERDAVKIQRKRKAKEPA